MSQTRARHTIIVSDVHLSQAHPEDPTDPMWMRYRRREHHPDADFAALVDHVLERFGSDSIELVFNGDVLDFDAPWVKDGVSSFDEFSTDDVGCAEQAQRIMNDHAGWFDATARMVIAGHRVLFLSGNHDLELYWPSVRQAIRDHIGGRARELGHPLSDAALEARVRFRTWFHVTDDGIYLEHGSQYDQLNNVPNPMCPVTRDGRRIHPVCGKLAFQRTGSRMGYFNPYDEETFYMGLTGYLAHFGQRYALSKRHIVRTWFLGAIRTVIDIWAERRGPMELDDADLERVIAETGASAAAARATHALRVPSAEILMLPIMRELWLDRIGLLATSMGVVGAAAILGGKKSALKAAAGAVALFAAYESVTPKPDVRTNDSAPPAVRRVVDIHGARAMCMGHTHRPSGSWEDDGRFYGNSGSWAPAFRDALCTEPIFDGRPVLFLTSERDDFYGGLFWWRRGRLEPAEHATRSRRDVPSSSLRAT